MPSRCPNCGFIGHVTHAGTQWATRTDLREALQSGQTFGAIAKQIGVTPEYVRQIWKKHFSDIPRRSIRYSGIRRNREDKRRHRVAMRMPMVTALLDRLGIEWGPLPKTGKKGFTGKNLQLASGKTIGTAQATEWGRYLRFACRKPLPDVYALYLNNDEWLIVPRIVLGDGKSIYLPKSGTASTYNNAHLRAYNWKQWINRFDLLGAV